MNESQTGQRGRAVSPTDDADRAVLALVTAGQLDALQELYDRYRAMAYSIALRITTDASLAEDVVQDAFLGVWRNAARYAEGRGSVKTWLLSIVHHRAVDAVRRRRPTVELPEREAVPPAALRCPTSGRRSPPISTAPGSRRRSRRCPMSSARRSSSPTGRALPSRRSPNAPAPRSARSRAASASVSSRFDVASSATMA